MSRSFSAPHEPPCVSGLLRVCNAAPCAACPACGLQAAGRGAHVLGLRIMAGGGEVGAAGQGRRAPTRYSASPTLASTQPAHASPLWQRNRRRRCTRTTVRGSQSGHMCCVCYLCCALSTPRCMRRAVCCVCGVAGLCVLRAASCVLHVGCGQQPTAQISREGLYVVPTG